MRADLLGRIPPTGAYPLVLVHDPDGLLDPPARQTLAERGYRLLDAPDGAEYSAFPLWASAQALRPWTRETPLLIASARPLETLPYDLWAQGHHVAFSLAEIAPGLALPCLRELTLEQRERLGEAPGAQRIRGPLGRTASALMLLPLLFETELDPLRHPAQFVLWLARVHGELGPLPPSTQKELAFVLRGLPAYREWPLETMLGDVAAYRAFVQAAWDSYLGAPAGERGGIFDDRRVQDGAGGLVRRGHLRPGVLPTGAAYRTGGAGPWASLMTRAGGAHLVPAEATSELDALLGEIQQRLADATRWEQWYDIAWLWARAAVLRQGGLRLPELTVERYTRAQTGLDTAWERWLRANYAVLAGQRLPTPHQVHHIPHWLARGRRSGQSRQALLVLDGCSLADWAMIGPAWQDRHPAWRLTQEAVLAQIPTVTSVSRQALVSGLRPDQMGDTLTTSGAEARRWGACWAAQGLAAEGATFAHRGLRDTRTEAGGERTAALCLIDSSIDELVHGASLGASQVQDALLRWLEAYSPALEAQIDALLAAGYAVHLTSDHGHVEAVGAGRPAGGALSESQGQRARLYADRRLAKEAAASTGGSLWGSEALLPEGWWALTSPGREAFTTPGEVCVTHGGTTIEELMVPLITIESEVPCR